MEAHTGCPSDALTVTGVRLLRRISLEVGVANLVDVAYMNHLNANNPFTGQRIREPGRVITTNLRVTF